MNSQFVVVKQAARTASNCCRLCLLNSCDLQPIQHQTVESNGSSEPNAPSLSQLIIRYLSIELLFENTNTSYICSDCKNTITKWHGFRESCLQNDGVYQKITQDPGKDDAAGHTNGYYEVEVKQEQELDICEGNFSGDFEETMFAEQNTFPKEKAVKENEPTVGRDLDRSKISESVTKSRMCKICGKGVKHMSNHLKTHSQDRSYQCPHCPLNFYSKNNWGKHVNVHTKERKYVCPVCDKIFLRSDNLKRHKQSHLEGQTYKCSYCPKTYRNRTGLLIHRMTHTQSPDIPCDGCDKKFYTKGQLDKHAVSHLAVKPFVCKICKRGCSRKYVLELHMKKYHPSCKEAKDQALQD
ncbi:zinc finger protein 39-like isoform X2 [Culex pipiens pallens]|uniref:zinc finger protein 39-like isoform X2 n=1 Tax=Culex pipiens pallens TaxID=42434 RepID=UPI0022AAA511|nr:zinc finger protein 39-like isoform X2 [Culex pipiens pallens]